MATSPPAAARLSANIFHPYTGSGLAAKWQVEGATLTNLLLSSADGIGETKLLNWFGADPDRIGLLVYALHGVVPTHIARELDIGTFRTDFAWASIEPGEKPLVGFVEIEHAKSDSLFKQRARKAPYIGNSFMSGFSQLIDWSSFGKGQAETDPQVSAVVGRTAHVANYYFALVVGQDRFMAGKQEEARFAWWKSNIQLGDRTSIATYTDIPLGANRFRKVHSAG